MLRNYVEISSIFLTNEINHWKVKIYLNYFSHFWIFKPLNGIFKKWLVSVASTEPFKMSTSDHNLRSKDIPSLLRSCLEYNDERKWKMITDCGIKERDINGHHLSKQMSRFLLEASEGKPEKNAFLQSRVIDEHSVDTVEIYTGGGGKETKNYAKLTKVEVAKFEDDWNKLWNLWNEPSCHRLWNGLEVLHPRIYHKWNMNNWNRYIISNKLCSNLSKRRFSNNLFCSA